VSHLICGVDEAGRGPLAGPVTASAVILPPDFPVHYLDDSKKLTEPERDTAAAVIRARAIEWTIGWVWPAEIDMLNIHRAALLAMERAVFALRSCPGIVLVDGKFPPDLPYPTDAVVGGDSRVRAIQAASIVAKVARDRWMGLYARLDGRYGFEHNRGYPTPEHRAAIARHGPSAIHRLSFRLIPSE
jgi:ribonuclease HII